MIFMRQDTRGRKRAAPSAHWVIWPGEDDGESNQVDDGNQAKKPKDDGVQPASACRDASDDGE